MKIYTLEYKQTVRCEIDQVFNFFKDPNNLSKLTPQELDFNIITPGPLTMREGLVIDYTIKIFGFPIRWTTYIAEYLPPHQFIDLQIKGPYSFWHHKHLFSGTAVLLFVLFMLDFAIVLSF